MPRTLNSKPCATPASPLPDSGYPRFGLRFMYPLDPRKPVIADSLKGCDAVLKVVREDLGLLCTLHTMYTTTVDEDRGKYNVRRNVYIMRDQFFGETRTLKRRPYKSSDDHDVVYREKRTLLLRKGRESVIEPLDFDDLDTDEVHWVTEVSSQYNTVKSHYMFYGNEAETRFTYGLPVLLAQVKPYEERKHVSRSSPAPEAQGPAANSEGPSVQRDNCWFLGWGRQQHGCWPILS
ncbi:hypothetical protein GGF50DRAFT_120228 [Schizophyllum commune]